jgi:class 3 adenylate cyclase/tetratricopeptide (TPR) repeat protein
MAACARCGTENPGEARFCSACGASLVAEESEVRKTVTVVFNDLSGSTALGERLDAESVRRLLGRYFEEARATLERYGGTVEKFVGDAVMAVFGIPQAHEDDALRACRATVELRERLADLNDDLARDHGIRLATRTGVNTGEIVAGAGETLVTGDAVNVAARLEQAAVPGEILIGARTHELVAAAVETEPVTPVAAKGKAMPVAAYRLLSVRHGAEAVARRFDLPMIDRQEELERLRRAFVNARAGRCCELVTVVGEAGLGKSRLAEELGRTLCGEATVLQGRCLPYGEGITYWPLVEILRRATQEFRARLIELFHDEPDAELIAGHLETAIAADSRRNSDELAWAARKLFEQIARKRPLLVVVDDIQWAAQTFVDLLEHVAVLARDAPMLLLCLARTELVTSRPGWPGERIELGPLSRVESEQLLDVLGGAVPDELKARIGAAAGGNPLFVEQMAAMVAADRDPAEVPPTIHALLVARIDGLAEDERDVLERASIVGQEFWDAAIRHLAPPAISVGRVLLDLVRQGLIHPHESSLPGEDAFQFHHLLIRDTAYEGLPKARRAELHERMAGWLETRETEAGHDAVIGYHLEQAHRYRAELGNRQERLGREASRRLSAAGRRALGRGDGSAAVSLLQRSVALVPRADASDVLVDLGTALVDVGDFAKAREILEEAVTVARMASDRVGETRAVVERDWLRHQTSEDADSGAVARRTETAIGIFEQARDDTGLARAWHVLAEVHNNVGQTSLMGRAAERSMEFARRAGDGRQFVMSLRLLVGAMVYGPTPAQEGLRLAEHHRALAEESGERVAEAVALFGVAAFHAMLEHYDEAWTRLRRSNEICGDLGLPFLGARSAFLAPLLQENDPEAAEDLLRTGFEALRDMGERGRMSTLACELARLRWQQHRDDEAWVLAEAGRKAAIADDVVSQMYWRSIEALVLARRGEHVRAMQLSDQALALAEPIENVSGRGDVLLDRAHTLLIAGRRDEAAAAAQRALEAYSAKENRSAARRARRLIEQAPNGGFAGSCRRAPVAEIDVPKGPPASAGGP